jgi:hypothetical protein
MAGDDLRSGSPRLKIRCGTWRRASVPASKMQLDAAAPDSSESPT